jgi:cytochrome b561
MNWRNSNTRYGTLSIGLHWLMLLLIAAVYACMELHENFPKGSALREGLKTWHFMLGLSVLALLLLRAALNLSGHLPRIHPEACTWPSTPGCC